MYKEALGISPQHSLVQTDTKWSQRKGQDTDTYWFDEKDEDGIVVAKYVVKDSTCIYPPQNRTVTYEKLSADGKLIKTGTIHE